ncbi:MAG: hypothetical protein ABI120_03150 [Gemmatimonadaceae bacterium]
MHFLNRSKHDAGGLASPGLATLLPRVVTAMLLLVGVGCYHPVLIPPATPEIAAKQAAADSVAKAERNAPPRCKSYVLLVENASPRAVEIYEVGHNSDRIVAIAQIGFTEVPMIEGTQQFVAVSRGEVMAAATNADNRSGDRVVLQRSCRPY